MERHLVLRSIRLRSGRSDDGSIQFLMELEHYDESLGTTALFSVLVSRRYLAHMLPMFQHALQSTASGQPNPGTPPGQ